MTLLLVDRGVTMKFWFELSKKLLFSELTFLAMGLLSYCEQFEFGACEAERGAFSLCKLSYKIGAYKVGPPLSKSIGFASDSLGDFTLTTGVASISCLTRSVFTGNFWTKCYLILFEPLLLAKLLDMNALTYASKPLFGLSCDNFAFRCGFLLVAFDSP